MPIAAPRPCSHPGCGVLVRDGTGRCPKHPKPQWQKKATETKRIGGRRRQALRAALIAANPLCAECSRQGRVTLGEERDHIAPLGEGGTEDESNTQLLCVPCHKVKSDAEAARGVRRAWAGYRAP